MTAAGWLAMAVAIAVLAAPAAAPARVGILAGRGRLADATQAAPSRGLRRRPPGRALAGCVACIGTVGVALAAGLALALASGAVSATGWLLARDMALRRIARRRRAELLSATRVLIGELEAGSRPTAALTAAAEAGPSLAAVFRAAADAAARAGDAAAVLAADPELLPIGLAWRLGEDVGAELAGVLTRVAHDLGAADEQRRNVEIALAGPRASAALLTGLPLLGIALGAAMGARPWAFLTGPPAGRAVCGAGVLLDVAGVLWMRRILRRAERS